MTDDRVEGAMRKGVGHVQDAFGGLTGDVGVQARGKANQTAGAVQDAVGQVRERASDLYEEAQSYAKAQPAVALAVTLGLGVVIGLVLSGGRKTVYVGK